MFIVLNGEDSDLTAMVAQVEYTLGNGRNQLLAWRPQLTRSFGSFFISYKQKKNTSIPRKTIHKCIQRLPMPYNWE